MFTEFRHWMTSPDGKSKSLRQAKQHERQVLSILQDASSKKFEMCDLFDRNKVRDNWLLLFEVNRQAGTVKSYLHSLRFFYKFLMCEHKDHDFTGECPRMIVVVENWISVYQRKEKKDRWKKDRRDIENLLTSSDFKALDESELVHYAKKTLENFKNCQKEPTLKQFTTIRDYIIMYLCINNASRTGALANMTCREFSKATNENGSYRVSVFNHKTVATSGPAVIVFTSKLYAEALVYFQRFRNQLMDIDKRDEFYFFLSWSGKKLSSNMVTGQLNSFWGKSVGHTEDRPRISATIVRKSAVTKVHNARPEMKKDLANLMCHSESTAKRTYYLQNKSKMASQTSSSLCEVLREDEQHEGDTMNSIITNCLEKEIRDKKITLTMVKEKKGLRAEFQTLSDCQLRDKIRYLITKDNVAPTGRIFYRQSYFLSRMNRLELKDRKCCFMHKILL